MKLLGMFMAFGAILDIVCEYRWHVFSSDVERSGPDEGMVTDPDALAFFDAVDPLIADHRKAMETMAEMAGFSSYAEVAIRVRRIANAVVDERTLQ